MNFAYLVSDTSQFNTAIAVAMGASMRPPGYGLPFNLSIQHSGSAFVATILLQDDVVYPTGWNRSNSHGNTVRLVESDSLTDLASQVDAIVTPYQALGANWYVSNFAAVPYGGNKTRYFQLIAQD